MNSEKQSRQWAHGADLVVGQLEAQGVKQVFGIPGAKIDKVFDSLLDSSIEIIPVRHEANAAFMAAAVGRLTGKAGVALGGAVVCWGLSAWVLIFFWSRFH